MKSENIRLVVILLFATIGIGRSQQQPGTTLAGEMLHLDMDKHEAVKRFSSCCKTILLGEDEVIVQNKKAVSHELGGAIYFQHAKVSGIAADRDYSIEESSYETALALYRLVDQMAKSRWTNGLAHGTSAKVTIYAYNLEGTNGSSKYVVVEFADGQSIRLEIDRPDPGADVSQQTVVSECVGKCADW